MNKFPSRISAARRNAESLLRQTSKREETYKLERDREHKAMVSKTERLRELRLAKEAEEKEAAAAAPPAPAKTKSRSRSKTK